MTSHAAFVRVASATEHLLLAYVRASSEKDGLGLSDLPSRLKGWVSGYPAMIASDADLARGAPRRGARVIRCERASRTVRAYSRDLVVQAETWASEVSGKWEAWDRVIPRGLRVGSERPTFSAAWRRRMAVKESPPLPSSSSAGELGRTVGYDRAQRANSVPVGEKSSRDEPDGRWDSLIGKEWGMFEEGGFDKPIDNMGSRLQFDLTEGAKTVSIAHRLR